VKLRVTLCGEDVEFLDAYANARRLASRSAALTHAVKALRDTQLRDEYELAVAEWDESEDSELWERTGSDGS
jgi:hypothetical protein